MLNSVDAGETVIFNLQKSKFNKLGKTLMLILKYFRDESIPILWRIPNRVLIPIDEGSADIKVITQRSLNIANNATIQVSIAEDTTKFKFSETDSSVTDGPGNTRILSTQITVFSTPGLTDSDDNEPRIAVCGPSNRENIRIASYFRRP